MDSWDTIPLLRRGVHNLWKELKASFHREIVEGHFPFWKFTPFKYGLIFLFFFFILGISFIS